MVAKDHTNNTDIVKDRIALEISSNSSLKSKSDSLNKESAAMEVHAINGQIVTELCEQESLIEPLLASGYGDNNKFQSSLQRNDSKENVSMGQVDSLGGNNFTCAYNLS